MDRLHYPETLSYQGNISENWRKWKQGLELYFIASGISDKAEETKAAIFLHLAGQDAREVFNTFMWETIGDDKKVDKIIEKFESYCTPRKNITWERHVFNSRNQKQGETIDQYTTELRSKAKSCEFGTLTDSLIRDRIVCGILSDQTRSRLLKEANLTLQGAIDICRADETTSTRMKSLATASTNEHIPDSEDVDLNLLNKHRKPWQPEDKKGRQPEDRPNRRYECRRCGGRHPPHR